MRALPAKSLIANIMKLEPPLGRAQVVTPNLDGPGGFLQFMLNPCGWDKEPLPILMGPKIGWFDSPLVHVVLART